LAIIIRLIGIEVNIIRFLDYTCYVTELILGHRGLGEESNYDYSKLKRKEKERESNASYFTINTSVCVR
jgi:hypothetical protein